jgi:NAD(P)-dependent dehydrogenase (short-subunit alcohol dehydrogenase family)
MSNYNGKTAVISGGAEGIGYSIAHALGQQGMNVVLGDIDENTLAKAEDKLTQEGINVLTVKMDVTDLADWQQLGEKAIERFGKIHMLVNNAGVGSPPGPIENTNLTDWRWVIDVNLMGVVHGANVIVPLIKQHEEGGWMINVASMAGMAGVPFAGAYTATKVAVVGMSEAWAGELAKQNIKVSVLCPAFVKTRIHLSGRNRQNDYKESISDNSKNAPDKPGVAAQLVENGIPPELVGLRVVEALNAGEFYIFTHPSHRAFMQKRFESIDQAFARAAKSPLLQDIHDPEILEFG